MRRRVNSRKLIAWLGLFAYLLLGLLNLESAITLTATLAGSHHVSIVADGSHQDVVFTHDPMQMRHQGHFDLHGHYPPKTEALDSISNNHHHPDHVVHLFKLPEQLSPYTPLAEPQYLHAIDLPMAVMDPISFFLRTLSIQAFPQPPPLKPKIHRFLNTIILLI